MASGADSVRDSSWEFNAPKFHDFTVEEPESDSEAEQWFGKCQSNPTHDWPFSSNAFFSSMCEL
jgi:hypothetical protein